MAQKRKISVRKILNACFTLASICCCIVALSSASKIENKKTLSKIEIDISNQEKYRFLDDSNVMEIVNKGYNSDLTHVPIGKLDTHNMEHELVSNPWVEDAQVYVDNAYTLHLLISQRTPVTRIFETSGKSYYLDKKLSIVPLSQNYVHYSTVVTNVPPLNDDSAGRALKAQILAVVRFVEKDSFWSAQVSQITVDSGNTFGLIPLLGNQKILLGDTSRMKEKFDDLFVFYKKVLNRIGWDKYTTLDLRYKGQVVASPSLPWKGPEDKAIATMSWANSMIDSNLKANKVPGKDSAKVAKVSKPLPAAKATIVKKPAKIAPPKVKPKEKKKTIDKKVSAKRTENKVSRLS